MKTLIVEDDFISRNLLLKYLQNFGQCDMATDGHEALAAFIAALDNNEPYDLICLDINIPEITGDAVLSHIRSAEESRGIHGLNGTKVVMTTGLSDKDSILGAFRSGCEAYLLKPISRGKFLEQLSKLGFSEIR